MSQHDIFADYYAQVDRLAIFTHDQEATIRSYHIKIEWSDMAAAIQANTQPSLQPHVQINFIMLERSPLSNVEGSDRQSINLHHFEILACPFRRPVNQSIQDVWVCQFYAMCENEGKSSDLSYRLRNSYTRVVRWQIGEIEEQINPVFYEISKKKKPQILPVNRRPSLKRIEVGISNAFQEGKEG